MGGLLGESRPSWLSKDKGMTITRGDVPGGGGGQRTGERGTLLEAGDWKGWSRHPNDISPLVWAVY